MAKERISGPKENEDRRKIRKPANPEAVRDQPGNALAAFQQKVGNRALQRLIAQRSESAPAELDDETAERINHERDGGQPLDSAVQAQAGPALGADFSGVRVHTSPEANELNQQLNARAFTTGQDIFFREGEYQPNSSGGQELITHELAHVVQQSSGAVGGSAGRMTVNPPGDRFEQEADALARQSVQPRIPAGVQREGEEDEEEIQAKQLQRQGIPEDEEEVQSKRLQREGEDDEEEIQAQKLQRQGLPENEEEIQSKRLQREGEDDEEEIQTKQLQRQELPEDDEEPVAQKQEMEEEEEEGKR
jgi:hypothetical protein